MIPKMLAASLTVGILAFTPEVFAHKPGCLLTDLPQNADLNDCITTYCRTHGVKRCEKKCYDCV